MLAEKSDKAMDEDLAIAESYSFRRAFKEKRQNALVLNKVTVKTAENIGKQNLIYDQLLPRYTTVTETKSQ